MAMKLPDFHRSPFTVHRSQNGQALIILLLVMVVGLTVGLSIATRTITDLRISTQTEESQKAFSAAEAGIEDALRRDLTAYSGCDNDGSTPLPDCPSLPTGQVAVTVTPQGNTSEFVTEQPVAQDDVAQINLDGTTASSVDVYWADDNDPASSLEITLVYYQSNSNYYGIEKWSYNTDASHNSNGFTLVTGPFQFNGKNYKGKAANVPISSSGGLPVTPKILRLRPFYGRASIAVQSQGGNLPLQSYKITSIGTTGQITRKVEVTKSLNALPPIFDYVLYSGTDISKQ